MISWIIPSADNSCLLLLPLLLLLSEHLFVFLLFGHLSFIFFPFIFISKLIDLTLKQGDFIAGDVVDGII